MNLQQHRSNFGELTGIRNQLRADLKKAERDLIAEAARKADLGQAGDVLNAAILATQQQVRGYLEKVVTSALQAVYGEDHGFHLDYEIRRNQPEITPWIVRGDEQYSPREEVGGGVLDVAALALRMAMWSLMDPRPAPVFLLDEPGKFVSRDKQADFGRMLREISKALGVQILMVSHSTDIIGQADKAYEVTLVDDKSEVKEIEV